MSITLWKKRCGAPISSIGGAGVPCAEALSSVSGHLWSCPINKIIQIIPKIISKALWSVAGGCPAEGELWQPLRGAARKTWSRSVQLPIREWGASDLPMYRGNGDNNIMIKGKKCCGLYRAPFHLILLFQTIKECTAGMDPDTWNAYHIVSNRARSVCYATRQQLFRRRAEHTVNALISTATSQLDAMKDLKVEFSFLQIWKINLNIFKTNTIWPSVISKSQKMKHLFSVSNKHYNEDC